MATVYNLKITDGTSTLLALTSGGVRVLRYTPLIPEAEIARGVSSEEEGAALLAAGRGNVIEPCRIAVTDNNALARTTEETLWRLFRRAEAYALRNEGVPLYWEFELVSGEGYWRSPLLRGDVRLDEDGALGWQWRGLAVALNLTIERAPWFEGPRTQVPLSNGNGTNVTSALTVYNHDDGGAGHDNYVAIGSSGVTGKLPCRAELELTSTTADARRTYDIYVGHNVWSNPASLPTVLEAENATALTAATTLTSAAYSNGSGRQYTWSTAAETLIARFDLSAALLTAAAGGQFRVFVRFTTAPLTAVVWARIKSQLFGLTDLQAEEQRLIAAGIEIQELGTLQLPPYLVGQPNIQGLSLVLTAQNYAGGANALNIDCLFLLPLNGWRHYRPRGYGMDNNVRLVETTDGVIYTDGWGSAGVTGHYTAEGEPLYLIPGVAQRLNILQVTADGTAAIDRTLAVRLWHRPRRAIL
jgi:hypothetical protein